jgi:hypothetical protein
MEKNMYGIQPRSLTTQELIRFSAELMELDTGLPKEWQLEVLRRLTVMAPPDESQLKDSKQLDLFL